MTRELIKCHSKKIEDDEISNNTTDQLDYYITIHKNELPIRFYQMSQQYVGN